MSDALAIRSTIERTLLNVGESVVVTPRTVSTDKWGSNTYSEGTPYSIVVAPDNFLPNDLRASDRGVLNDASLLLITSGNEVLAENSLATIDGANFVVLSIEEFIIDGVTVAKQIVMGEFNG